MMLDLRVDTVAVLIKAIYETTNEITTDVIPPIVYYNIASELLEYNLDSFCLEEWVETELVIAPVDAYTEEDLQLFRTYPFHVVTDCISSNIISFARRIL